jgi:NAD(P)-dependent dehydrogenase (short-subunit alcohol dehydrogenase family)
MKTLEGKVALVTGAAQGIGRNYAIGLAKAGASVCVSDIANTSETEAMIAELGGRVIGARTDITNAASLATLMESIKAEFGRLDILVNNAALFAALSMSHFADIPSDEWDRVMAVNVRGCWETIRAAWPLMAEGGGGTIVNVSSATVFKGSPNLLHYVTSKAAIVGMTRSLARELAADNILINAIAPGLVMSPQIETHGDWSNLSDGITATRAIKRNAVPEDMVGTVLFLVGPDSNFMTGQTLVVDGGVVMH